MSKHLIITHRRSRPSTQFRLAFRLLTDGCSRSLPTSSAVTGLKNLLVASLHQLTYNFKLQEPPTELGNTGTGLPVAAFDLAGKLLDLITL